MRPSFYHPTGRGFGVFLLLLYLAVPLSLISHTNNTSEGDELVNKKWHGIHTLCTTWVLGCVSLFVLLRLLTCREDSFPTSYLDSNRVIHQAKWKELSPLTTPATVQHMRSSVGAELIRFVQANFTLCFHPGLRAPSETGVIAFGFRQSFVCRHIRFVRGSQKVRMARKASAASLMEIILIHHAKSVAWEPSWETH